MILILVALAGFCAGFMNVLAGGGSFVTLPALIAAGLSALGANASSTVALFPAQAVTSFMARGDLKVLGRENVAVDLRVLAGIALIGGFAGALLLLVTPPSVFTHIVPWLILFATGVFARGSKITEGARGVHLDKRGIYVIQAAVSVYGGYFGGGIGILMLAALTLFGLRDLKAMNGLKIVLSMLMNVAAVLTFVVAGLVQWLPTLVLSAAAVAGGIVGMVTARRVSARFIRAFVIVVGVVLTIFFFWTYGIA